MKLLSVNLARAIWIFNINELNPHGKYAGLINGLVDRYGFTKWPTTPEEMDEAKGLKFINGKFTLPSGESIIINFTMFNWGLVVDSRSSTQSSEACIKDGLDWTVREFGYADYNDIIRSKSYQSEVHVHTAKTFDSLSQKLQLFAEKLSLLVKGHGSLSYKTAGITFSNDPGPNNISPFQFRFERVDSTQFNENRYYSVAPLETDVHLEMLDELESILL